MNDKIIENFEKASRKLDDKIAELKDKLSKHIESQCKNVEKRSNNIRHSVEEHKLKMQDFVEKIDAFENVWPSGRYCVFAHRDRLKPRCPEGLLFSFTPSLQVYTDTNPSRGVDHMKRPLKSRWGGGGGFSSGRSLLNY